jgi:hypothetical protein
MRGKPSEKTKPGTLLESVADILRQHVVLEVEGIDRMYLNVYVPVLQAVEGVLKFIRIHRGHPVLRRRWSNRSRVVSSNPLSGFPRTVKFR